MARRFLITGTDTGVGKTVLGCALGFALQARGLRVGVMKPAETGCESRDGELQPADAIALKLASGSSESLDLICPYRYRSPLAPAAAADHDSLPPLNLDRIGEVFDQIASRNDVVLVEGAGGLSVPLTWQTNYADLANQLDLTIVVVVANRLGCINSTLLTLDYAAHNNLKIAGYVLNDVDAAESVAARTNLDSLRKLAHVPCLGTIGWKEPVSKALIRQIAGDLFRE